MARMDAKLYRDIVNQTPAEYRGRLVIDCDGVATPLARVIEPWQLADFQAMDGALLRVTGKSAAESVQCFWLERPRGHSKTSDIAANVAYMLMASQRPLRGVIAAADQDQAQLTKDAVGRLLQLNDWLRGLLEIQRYKIINPTTGSECVVVTSDANTSYGPLYDFIVCDEITHWSSEDLFSSLFSSVAKRGSCLMLCIGNAGFVDSWQWTKREIIRTDPAWCFSRLDGPAAAWITPDRLAKQQRLLPDVAYRRLWLNEWSSGSGDALNEADILAAIHDGPMDPPRRDEVVVMGVDLGLKHDATACVTVAKDKAGFLRVLRVYRWQAANGGRVDLAEVERAILADHHEFHLRRVSTDPNEAGYLVQNLRRWSVPILERQQQGSYLVQQAMELVTAFRDSRIKILNNEFLVSELKKARIEEKSYGVKITAERDQTGHGDTVTALSIALAEIKDLHPLTTRTEGWQPQKDVADALRGDGVGRSRPASQLRWGGKRM